MKIKFFMNKQKIISLILIFSLIAFCYFAATLGIRRIIEPNTPLSSGNIEALFYIQNPESGSVTCVGDGLINTTEEISNNSGLTESVIVSSPDYSAIVGEDLGVVWDTIKLADNIYKVFGTLQSGVKSNSSAASMIFSTIEEMKSSNVTSGTRVATKGYYTPGDGGGATYQITDSPTYSIDEIFVITLNSGQYAQMQFSRDSIINVACAGIVPNQNCAAEINRMSISAENKVAGIKFNDGIYLLDQPIKLESLIYQGSGNTTLSITNDFNTRGDKLIYTSPNDGKSYNIKLYGMDIIFETTTTHPLHDRETVLLALHNIASCDIDNCNIIARPASTNGDFMKVDTLWFRFSDSHKNIHIKNSTIKNQTGSAYTGPADTVLVGGVLWISGKSSTSDIRDITIENVEFETSTTDEAICLWNGVYTNINFNNCMLHNYAHLCHNFITLDTGLFHNVTFNNLQAEVNAPTCYIIKTYDIASNSHFDFNNCQINIDNNSSDNINYSIVQTSGDSINTSYNFNSLNVQLASSSKFRQIVGITKSSDANYNFKNCYVNGTLTYGFAFLENTNNINLSCTSSSINTNNILMNLKRAYGSNINFTGNTIESKVTTTVTHSGDFDYTFTNNTLTASSPGVLVNTNNINSVTEKSNLTYTGNTINSTKSPSLYYTNSSISESEYMTISK